MTGKDGKEPSHCAPRGSEKHSDVFGDLLLERVDVGFDHRLEPALGIGRLHDNKRRRGKDKHKPDYSKIAITRDY